VLIEEGEIQNIIDEPAIARDLKAAFYPELQPHPQGLPVPTIQEL
jgi:hypothetical protein